ncbi:MAG: C45 family autoproteolytic acyltransferase/hydrolase [Paracoccaceae bacterium]
MQIAFQAIANDPEDRALARLFHRFWPDYRRWWTREGFRARPTWWASRGAIAEHMPEILALYDRVCERTGGSDAEARFLSFFCPPPYLSGCSQAIWPGAEPVLVRNYDYAAQAFDAVVLRTDWLRPVMGLADGLWGLVDGVNDAGLAVSLTFGGRQVVGDGFGVPILLRYVLETCETAPDAAAALARIPCHMSYNVTLLDAARRYATVHLAPDRKAIVTHAAVATNHQGRVEWSSHARFTATVERERYLLQRLTLHPETEERFVGAFLKPPLYSVAFDRGFGTLYTAVYRPRESRLELRWPGAAWTLRLDAFAEDVRAVALPDVA